MQTDSIGDDYRHCGDLVRAHAKDQFIACLFAPAERRPYLLALYAFALEIGRAKTVHEPMAGMIRLQWWLEALRGERNEEATANPVMRALRDAAEKTGISLLSLADAVLSRQAELSDERPIVAEQAVFVAAAGILGGEGEAVRQAAHEAAEAMTWVVEAGGEQKARAAYAAFRARLADVPRAAWPAFLTVSLVPLRLANPAAPQWRRQIALLRAAWLGFPKA